MDILAAPEDVQKFLGLQSSQDVELLTALLEAASMFILNWCNRAAFKTASYTETYNGTGSATLVVHNRPLIAVSAVSIDGSVIPPSVDYGNGYVNDSLAVRLRGYKFTRGFSNVAITYVGGYPDIPADVRQAAVEVTAEKYQRRLRMGVSSKSIGQETISYTSNDLSATNKNVLREYTVRSKTP